LTLNVFFHKSNGKNSLHFRFDGRKYSEFPPKTIGDHNSWETVVMANSMKIRWKTVTCRAFNSFSCDRLTHSLIHSHRDGDKQTL